VIWLDLHPINKASAQGECVHLGRIWRGDHNWRRSAWWLSRRFPKEWGRRRPKVTVAADASTQVQQARLELQAAICGSLMTEEDRALLDQLRAQQRPKGLPRPTENG
jgi:hypothetical protein